MCIRCTFTFMHLADAFIQSDLQCIQAIHLYCQYVHLLCIYTVHLLCIYTVHLLCIYKNIQYIYYVYINTHAYSIYFEKISMYLFIFEYILVEKGLLSSSVIPVSDWLLLGSGGCEDYGSGDVHHRLGAVWWGGIYTGEWRILSVQSHHTTAHRRLWRYSCFLCAWKS